MISSETATQILTELDEKLAQASGDTEAVQTAMQLLHDRLSHYHWVGVYSLQDNTLVLGPYVGPPTEHVNIPIGRGVCGTAIVQNANQIVADVRQLWNYLACNPETRSEIVVLIRHPQTKRIIGQIDVDSTEVGAFDRSDEVFLQEVASRIAKYMVRDA